PAGELVVLRDVAFQYGGYAHAGSGRGRGGRLVSCAAGQYPGKSQGQWNEYCCSVSHEMRLPFRCTWPERRSGIGWDAFCRLYVTWNMHPADRGRGVRRQGRHSPIGGSRITTIEDWAAARDGLEYRKTLK